jgi:16S rRNA (cytosine967-C5)-methyltransferase
MRTGRSSRRLAVLCLAAWDGERRAIQPLIESLIYRSPLAAGDRHLAVMLVQGVLRRMQDLDAVISRFSRFPLSRMKSLTRMALRIGVYQLLFLDRIPESAAVNETVNVLQEEHQPRWLVNFTNGVLRTVAKNRTALRGPDGGGMEGTGIHNHPEWLVRRWEAAYGQDNAREICRRNNREPVLTIRINTLQTDAAGLAGRLRDKGYTARPGRYAPQSLVVESFSGPVADLPGFAEGLFHVQDEAAQLVSLLLAPFDKGAVHLDACAGLGGKTCHLAQLLADGAELTAVEPNNHRFRLLEQNIRRLHLTGRVRLFHGRLERFAELAAGAVPPDCRGCALLRYRGHWPAPRYPMEPAAR